jgi:hypothetical protein
MGPANLTAAGAKSGGAGADEMPTTLKTAAESYLRAKVLSRGTRNEYLSTLRKWKRWGGCPTRSQAARLRIHADVLRRKRMPARRVDGDARDDLLGVVVFFNKGVDTGTVWRSKPAHKPILSRHVIWDRKSRDREAKERSPWGWLFYRRVKTDKAFHRPMNRLVHAHLRSLMPENPRPDDSVFLGGGARPNARFKTLCVLAGIKSRLDIETGEEEPWELKDLRKTCATYYDEHVPESSVQILGHSVGGITYRHYAHRAPLAFRGFMTLLQPSAFSAILRGGESECRCCRRRFADAG